jgi:hypothetical protein
MLQKLIKSLTHYMLEIHKNYSSTAVNIHTVVFHLVWWQSC